MLQFPLFFHRSLRACLLLLAFALPASAQSPPAPAPGSVAPGSTPGNSGSSIATAAPGAAAVSAPAASGVDQEQLPIMRSSAAGAGRASSSGSALSGQTPWVLQTLGALGVVIALVFAARSGLRRLGNNAAPAGAANAMVEVLGRVSIAPRCHVIFVRLGHRILVVGQSPQGLASLADIDQPEEIADLLAAHARQGPHSMSRGFSNLMQHLGTDFDRKHRQVDEGGDVTEIRTDRAREHLSSLLARISRIGRGPAGPASSSVDAVPQVSASAVAAVSVPRKSAAGDLASRLRKGVRA
ncbi:MAG: flagellar biosynthetic protein FliO [Phycisphaeraceae bacterium]|nr:flagellar biosynthetic protein FliO [Phycisphaeraceae bacterium]